MNFTALHSILDCAEGGQRQRSCISCWDSVGATPMVDTTQVPRYGDKRYICQKPVWERFDATQALQTPEGQTRRFCCRSHHPRIRTTASGMAKRGGLESRKSDYKKFNDLYYDLATDFYEYGWGSSFHFARRVPGESFKAALVRHEHHFANALGLKPKISGTHGQSTRGQSDWVW